MEASPTAFNMTLTEIAEHLFKAPAGASYRA
jgi:hypothetical protein